MSSDLTDGGRAEVAFSFFTGSAGVSAANDRGEVTVAVRLKRIWGDYEPTGTVGCQPVDVLGIERSPVAGYTRIIVRFQGEDSAG